MEILTVLLEYIEAIIAIGWACALQAPYLSCTQAISVDSNPQPVYTSYVASIYNNQQ